MSDDCASHAPAETQVSFWQKQVHEDKAPQTHPGPAMETAHLVMANQNLWLQDMFAIFYVVTSWKPLDSTAILIVSKEHEYS